MAGISWAKWDPYGHKLVELWHTRAWSGAAMFPAARAGSAPSWHAAWSFLVGYGSSVWVALMAALLIAAALDALVPRRALVRLLDRRTRLGGTLVGGLLAVPCMMCTCCSAPLAVTLRRRGVPTGPVLGYWLGNPVLNPAVLVFLALVAPWQWVVTRAVVGAVLVFGAGTVIARFGSRDGREPAAAGPARPGASVPAPAPEPESDWDLRAAPARFARTLARLTLTLVPEYLVVVLAVGALRGWLFPLGANAAHWGILALLVAAVVGTLVVIPTAGEIPILQGLAAVGLGAGPLGALLLTLPAVSLPSMVMVGRSLTWRVTALVGGAVVAAGVAGGAVLWALR